MTATKATTITTGRACVAVVAAVALVAGLTLLVSAPKAQGQGNGLVVQFKAGTSISDKAYTVGARVDEGLPEVTVTYTGDIFEYDLTYSTTGLPAGLSTSQSIAHGRMIYGTPEAPTNGPVTVTYTAEVTTYVYDENTDTVVEQDTASASLTFKVTVDPAVAFGEAATTFLSSKLFIYDADQGSWRDSGDDGKIEFPAASGGTGTLTYRLVDSDSNRPLAEVASGITFDTATRKLGGTPAASAQKQWAVRYWAEDENGSRAVFSSTVYAGGFGGL
ncbi:hypothetical protein [Candidatus Poriferisocius sp.]|uniref:hypothetical protein n=1 Tax=Candidatus Poriferisocius sp. TaxID=3101276 RepID=UPI003B020FB8